MDDYRQHMKSGHNYFTSHFSDLPVDTADDEVQRAGDALPLTPNQAVFVYDYIALKLLYARGFAMMGFDDAKITIVDIFNTAIPEQREACGEISGKGLSLVKNHRLESLKNGIVINYAGRSVSGEIVHLMLEGSVFGRDANGNFVSSIVTISRIPHLPVPKIVRWNVFGNMADQMIADVDEGLINANRISNREAEVLTGLADGKTMGQLAEGLCISIRTVEQHVLNMRRRFDCANVSQLIAYGKDMGLV